MRLVLLTAGLALSFYAVPTALCQSPQSGLFNPAQPQSSPPAFQSPGKDFSNSPPLWQHSSVTTTHILIRPPAHIPRPPVEPQIDPDMIIRPSKSHIGDQPQGSLVAQNLYPGLRLLPIGGATGKPIPTDWPKLKLEPIPIDWPNLQMLPVDSDSAAAQTSPAK